MTRPNSSVSQMVWFLARSSFSCSIRVARNSLNRCSISSSVHLKRRQGFQSKLIRRLIQRSAIGAGGERAHSIRKKGHVFDLPGGIQPSLSWFKKGSAQEHHNKSNQFSQAQRFHTASESQNRLQANLTTFNLIICLDLSLSQRVI